MIISSLFSTLKILAIAVFVFLLYSIAPTQAQTIPNGLELNGYAWSSTIGWISLNCRTGGEGRTNICANSNYKVSVNSSRNLEGYAWSSNIGWVRFSNVSAMDNHPGFPAGAGTISTNARLASANYQNTTLEGWIRVCSGTASPANGCNDGGQNPASGDWDGWISLKGSGYGVNTANFGSPQYVWGGTVVGWVDMSSAVSWYTPTITILSGNGCTITTAGESTCDGRLTWTFAEDVTNPTITRTSPASPSLSFTGQTATNRSVSLVLGSNTFTARSGANGVNITTLSLSAVCGSGLVNIDGVCQLTPPAGVTILDLTANPTIVRRGGTSQITWELSGTPATGQCSLSGPGFANVDIVGLTNYTTPELNNASVITLDCGSSTSTVRVTIVPDFTEI